MCWQNGQQAHTAYSGSLKEVFQSLTSEEGEAMRMIQSLESIFSEDIFKRLIVINLGKSRED